MWELNSALCWLGNSDQIKHFNGASHRFFFLSSIVDQICLSELVADFVIRVK